MLDNVIHLKAFPAGLHQNRMVFKFGKTANWFQILSATFWNCQSIRLQIVQTIDVWHSVNSRKDFQFYCNIFNQTSFITNIQAPHDIINQSANARYFTCVFLREYFGFTFRCVSGFLDTHSCVIAKSLEKLRFGKRWVIDRFKLIESDLLSWWEIAYIRRSQVYWEGAR